MKKIITFWFLILLVWVATTATAAGSYNITYLGTLGGTLSDARGINDFVQIVGNSNNESGKTRAFIWENGIMTDLGCFGGANNSSQAYDINNNGQVTGYSQTDISPWPWHAFLLEDGNWTDLGTLGGIYSFAVSINDFSQIVGYSRTVQDLPLEAFFWENGNMTGLGIIYAHDINNLGQVVGRSWNETHYNGFLWENGELTDLGQCEAYGINDHGQIVGVRWTEEGQHHAFLLEGGTWTDLGTLGGSSSYAFSINNHGQITGYSKNADEVTRAFICDSINGMQDLGIVEGTHSYAYDINNNGQVVGNAMTAEGRRAFLASPVFVSSITVISPNAGEELFAGETFEITWSFEGNVENVKIEYSANNGSDWITIAAEIENDGTYEWDAPCVLSDESLIRISDVDSDASDTSDAVFSIIDNIVPEIEVSATPDILWPPNHKMVQVTTTVAATDNCDTEPAIEFVSIVMSESDKTITYDPDYDLTVNDGLTSGDIQIIDYFNFYLRCERSGKSTGRIYIITYKAIDDSGNESTAYAEVLVPHSM